MDFEHTRPMNACYHQCPRALATNGHQCPPMPANDHQLQPNAHEKGAPITRQCLANARQCPANAHLCPPLLIIHLNHFHTDLIRHNEEQHTRNLLGPLPAPFFFFSLQQLVPSLHRTGSGSVQRGVAKAKARGKLRRVQSGNARQKVRREAVASLNFIATPVGVPTISVKTIGKQVEMFIEKLEKRR